FSPVFSPGFSIGFSTDFLLELGLDLLAFGGNFIAELALEEVRVLNTILRIIVLQFAFKGLTVPYYYLNILRLNPYYDNEHGLIPLRFPTPILALVLSKL
ncbi:hypothetical protein NEUTE2DRAFT_43937, partial [Neurospora tetrasperma FGSC 2509]